MSPDQPFPSSDSMPSLDPVYFSSTNTSGNSDDWGVSVVSSAPLSSNASPHFYYSLDPSLALLVAAEHSHKPRRGRTLVILGSFTGGRMISRFQDPFL